MARQRQRIVAAWVCAVALLCPTAGLVAQQKPVGSAAIQPPQGRADRSDVAILRALMENPITAPYRFSTAIRGARIALVGRVGTKQIHDLAIRIAISVTPSIDDQIVIDTAEAARSANNQTGVTGTTGGGVPYVYPEPLFGWYDEPFYGFDAPVLSWPPWWNGLNGRRNDPSITGSSDRNDKAPDRPTPPASPMPSNPAIPEGSVELTIDPRGVAVLRGTVPNAAARAAVGQAIASSTGVSDVINLLKARDAGQAPAKSAMPPPAPTPDVLPPPTPQPPKPIIPGPAPVDARIPPVVAQRVPPDGNELNRRLAKAVGSRPALLRLDIQATARDGVAYLSGKTPTAFEAMLAFRAVQQTPGIREIVDQIEFQVPEGAGDNPLLHQARPDDLEPYFEAQLRRHLGDLAHVDRVRVNGDRLDVRGAIRRAEDRPQVDAILRSIAILRGFKLTTAFQSE